MLAILTYSVKNLIICWNNCQNMSMSNFWRVFKGNLSGNLKVTTQCK